MSVIFDIAIFILISVFLLLVLFGYYVVLMNAIGRHKGKNNWQEKSIKWVWLPIFLVFDALYNIVILTLWFQEIPKQWVVTMRLKHWRKQYEHISFNELSWNKQRKLLFAVWMCDTYLDPYDTLTGDHC